VAFTITSFAEIPLWVLATVDSSNSGADTLPVVLKSYGACEGGDEQVIFQIVCSIKKAFTRY